MQQNIMIRSACKYLLTNGLSEKLLFQSDDHNDNVWYIETDPQNIKYISLIPENAPSLMGRKAYTGICNGYWNYLKRPFRQHSFYITVSEILDGIPFEQTSLYKKVEQKRISKTEARRILKKLNWLIHSLSQKGYLSQFELDKMDQMWWVGNVRVPQHEIIVAMDSRGDLVRLAGGKHRLAVAQQIGIKRMPAVLSFIHKNALDKLPPQRRLITGNLEDYRPFSVSVQREKELHVSL